MELRLSGLTLQAALVSFLGHTVFFSAFLYIAPASRSVSVPASVEVGAVEAFFVEARRPPLITTKSRAVTRAKSTTSVVIASSDESQTPTDSIGGPVDQGGAPSVLQKYVHEIVHLINDRKHYPSAALVREEQGVVVLSVDVSSEGRILEIKIIESSSFSSLDHAALKALQEVRSFPPPPATLSAPLRLRVPMHYVLTPK